MSEDRINVVRNLIDTYPLVWDSMIESDSIGARRRFREIVSVAVSLNIPYPLEYPDGMKISTIAEPRLKLVENTK